MKQLNLINPTTAVNWFRPIQSTLATCLFSLIVGTSLTACAAEHVMQTLDEVKWGDAPPMLPAGAKIAVLSGNPGAEGLYTVRLKFPAHYGIPAHSHPKDEYVTILRGTLFMGMADKLDTKSGKALPPGSFSITPTGVNHYAYTDNDEVTILLHGMGPVDFKYVNPADDPRNNKK